MKHKNMILIVISLILLIYAGFISLFPSLLTSTFNIDKFEQKIYDSTSLVTTIDSIDFKIKPNLNMIITIRNWTSKYIDDQDCFAASMIQVTTNPSCVFTKKFKIKDLYLKNVKYLNQILPSGENKLSFLPPAFNSQIFGAKKITVIPGPVKIKNFKIRNMTQNDYNEVNRREVKYSEQQVKDFLSQFYFSHVYIK